MGASAKKIVPEEKHQEDPSIVLAHRYKHRIKIVKSGKTAMNASDYSTALKRYTEFVKIHSDFRKLQDQYELRPSHFDPIKDARELLLLSQIFFEMARIYDSSPRFSNQTQKCLDQFVRFSINQPYQVLNSELLRKFMRKTAFKNPDMFRSSYEKIFIHSNKCYVVTFCFGDSHPTTHQFRKLKNHLLHYELGKEFVRLYYIYSSAIIARMSESSSFRMFNKVFIKPLLFLFSKTLLKFIIK